MDKHIIWVLEVHFFFLEFSWHQLVHNFVICDAPFQQAYAICLILHKFSKIMSSLIESSLKSLPPLKLKALQSALLIFLSVQRWLWMRNYKLRGNLSEAAWLPDLRTTFTRLTWPLALWRDAQTLTSQKGAWGGVEWQGQPVCCCYHSPVKALRGSFNKESPHCAFRCIIKADTLSKQRW